MLRRIGMLVLVGLVALPVSAEAWPLPQEEPPPPSLERVPTWEDLVGDAIATNPNWSEGRAELAIWRFFGGFPFTRNDCSYIEPWFRQAGLDLGHTEQEIAEVWPRAERIARKESGCCPETRGGDRRASDCSLIRIAERNHRSDAGTWQINGIHYSPAHRSNTRRGHTPWLCADHGVCEYSQLLDPYTGAWSFWKLYERSGWAPW